MEQIPTALPSLTPCLLMSPLSIAQYLPPGRTSFDLVVFDEASQIPVWDAIGAMIREKREADWEQYLAGLRTEHCRKKRLLEVLDTLSAKPIVKKKR